MSVRPVPVLISRMNRMAKKVHVSDAGIRADFPISQFIHRVIIHAECNQPGGDNVLCINFRTCRNDYLSMAAQVVDVVQELVRLI
jgi:hypothetical protein